MADLTSKREGNPALKPCPFCGGEAESGRGRRLAWVVACREPGCYARMECGTRERAEALWNHRAASETPERPFEPAYCGCVGRAALNCSYADGAPCTCECHSETPVQVLADDGTHCMGCGGFLREHTVQMENMRAKLVCRSIPRRSPQTTASAQPAGEG